MRTQFSADAEFDIHSVNCIAVRARRRPLRDRSRGFDVLGRRHFPLAAGGLLLICGDDPLGDPVAFGLIVGYPREGPGKIGGGSGLVERLGLLPV